MTIQEDLVGAVTVVAPVGRIDSSTADALDARLVRLSAAGVLSVVVDFEGVEYISSAGLRVLLSMAKRVREKRGALALCSLPDGVRQVFELAGFLPLFAIQPSRDRAIQALTSP
jgi:anti-anti-sigma factor